MIGIFGGIGLLVLALLALALQRLYSSIPAKELKRLAARGDHLAQGLYRSAAYGASLRLLLWAVAILALTSGLLLLAFRLPAVVVVLLTVLVLTTALVILPSLQLTVRTARFAAALAPGVVWILSKTHVLLDRTAQLITRYREIAPHSLLYEKEDLQRLLTLQKEQADNRITPEELAIASQALAFGDKHATEIARPHHQVHLVNADDAIGPILLDQLHKTGQSSFLVYKGSKENIIGSLSMRDAVNAKQEGHVVDLVRHDLAYVHEDFTLRQVLSAFQNTGHQIAAVINSFEELVGIITLEDVLRQLLGEGAAAEDDNYEQRAAVAAYRPRQTAPQPADEPAEKRPSDDNSSPEATEVVE